MHKVVGLLLAFTSGWAAAAETVPVAAELGFRHEDSVGSAQITTALIFVVVLGIVALAVVMARGRWQQKTLGAEHARFTAHVLDRRRLGPRLNLVTLKIADQTLLVLDNGHAIEVRPVEPEALDEQS